MQFGFAVPIFANPGVAHFRTPNFERLEWQPVASAIREAEALGYGSVWVADHMFLGREGEILEGWTTLSVVAGLTERVRLGSIHLGNGFRHAPLVAKMASTLDFISGGRVELFIDPGWRSREHTAYGFDWEPDRAVRARQLGEAIELIRATWSGQPTSYNGEFYRLDGAINTPTPLQEGGPRIWIGEAFDEATLDVIARQADVWNSMPAGLEVLRDKITLVDEACNSRRRDPTTLTKTLETQVLVLGHRNDLDHWLERWEALERKNPPGDAMTDVVEFVLETNARLAEGMQADDYRDEFLIGTPDEICEKLAAYRELDIEEVMCWFMDFPEATSMRRMAEEVLPKFR